MFHNAMRWYLMLTFGRATPYFLGVLGVAALVVMLFSFPRGSSFRKRRLIGPLVSLPAIWLLAGVIGEMFWRAHPAPLTAYEFLLAPGLSLLVAGFYVWRLEGARLFTIAYGVVNLQLTVLSSLLMAMGVTGAWP